MAAVVQMLAYVLHYTLCFVCQPNLTWLILYSSHTIGSVWPFLIVIGRSCCLSKHGRNEFCQLYIDQLCLWLYCQSPK